MDDVLEAPPSTAATTAPPTTTSAPSAGAQLSDTLGKSTLSDPLSAPSTGGSAAPKSASSAKKVPGILAVDSKDAKLQQNAAYNTPEKMMAVARHAHGILAGVIQKAAAAGGAKPAIPDAKSMERAAEKVSKDYGGDWTKITDIARGSVVATTVDGLSTAYETFTGMVDVKKVKNRFKDTKEDGYRDLNVVVQVPGTDVLGEVQFHVEQIQDVKMGVGHDLYEEAQKITRKAADEKRALTPEEAAELQKVNAKSKAAYDEAWQAALEGRPGKPSAKGHGHGDEDSKKKKGSGDASDPAPSTAPASAPPLTT